MLGKKHSRAGVIAGVIVSAAIFVFAGWLLLNRQYALDQINVWTYRPADGIKTIEERVDFTDHGTFYFHATHPSIDNADTFNEDCPRQEVGSPILGCYASGRIYIYDIANEQLDGIEEVTAAHEMLHAVWERMSTRDQKRIGNLLRAEYAKLADGDLKTRMDYYARTEPGQFENELHSIIGTEVVDLSDELEQYYARYFDDRQKVLALHSKYDSVFENLRNQSESLYDELVTLGTSISTRSAQYNQDVTQLSADIDDFNARADSGSFSSINTFNQERAALVARSNQLAAEQEAINNDIATYNAKYQEYEALASQIEILNKSIDSIGDLEPAPSL